MSQSIAYLLKQATLILPPLEADVLLAHVLQVNRSYLHTWPEKILENSSAKKFNELIESRLRGEPIAYLTGHREFWSLDLMVSPDVLIPRHETELLVETVLNQVTQSGVIEVADLGTGSGAIALAIAHERSSWRLHATDASSAALEIARQNAKNLAIANICFYQGDWCNALPNVKFNAIVSNPPYLAAEDVHLTKGDLRFEPHSALISQEQGLKDISNIIFQAKNYLISGGKLFLEHGFEQVECVTHFLIKEGYTDINTYRDLAGHNRVTIANWLGF